MKKTVSLFLCVILCLSVLSGCNSADETKRHVLKVGYARVDATPDYSVPLAGLGDAAGRPSAGVADRLYVTCIALTDENDNTVLLYHLDLLYPYGAAMMSLSKITEATGVDFKNIMVASTHNHSAPNPDLDVWASEQYAASLKQWMLDMAVAAMEDRKPAEMYIATAYPEHMNFVRHYLLKDGSRGGWTRHRFDAVSHLYEADNALQLIKFTREGGKDVLLMNWQGHPMAHASDKTKIQSDVDVFRREIEAKLDCQFAFFLGASGDVNSGSDWKTDRNQDWYVDDYVQRGKMMAQYVADAVPTFEKMETGLIKTLRNRYKAYNISGLTEMNITLDAFSIGDVAFVGAPYEMFGKNGIAIRESSPFKMTFVSTCTNGYTNYIPAGYAFEYDCYEVTMNTYKPGTAELLVSEYISMLKQLKESK